ARAVLDKQALSSLDQHFLAGLQNTCRYHVGQITEAEYVENERKLAAQAPREFALQHELEARRLDHLKTPDAEERAPLWRALRDTVASILFDESASDSLKLRARLAQLYADIFEAGAAYMRVVMRLRMRKDMQLTELTSGVRADIERIVEGSKPLLDESGRLLQEAIEQRHPLLYAEALVTQALIVIHRTTNQRFLLASNKQPLPLVPPEVVADLRQRLEAAACTFERAGNLELEIWAKLFLADWLEVS